MSIKLHDVYVPGTFGGAKRPLLNGIDLEFPDHSRIGVLGTAKSGKTTLLRLICGSARAESGIVERNVRTSWPIPLNSFVSRTATVARNIRFIARLYGIPNDEFPRSIAAMVGLEEFLNVPIQKCPRFVTARLALALGIGLEFDTYLFDGALAPIDKPFKPKAVELVTSRMTGRGYVLATSVPAEVENYCDSTFVLESGKAKYFTDTKQGIEYFKELLAAEKQAAEKEAKQVEEEDEDASDGLGDIDIVGATVADAFE